MYQDKSRKRLWILFLLSLCIHGLLLFISLIIKYPDQPFLQQLLQQQAPPPPPPAQAQSTQPEPQPLAQKPEEDEVPFILNLKDDSTFGASVIFQDMPETLKEDGPVGMAMATPEDAHTSEAQETEQLSETQEPETTDQEQPIEQQAPEQEKTPDLPITSPEVSQPADQPVIKKKKRKKRKKTYLAAVGTKNAAPITHDMTLTKLAEGFLNYTNQRKNETVDLNTKDFKYAGYLQKVSWYLQNSFHINNKPLTLDHDMRTNVILYFEINEDGNLIDSNLSPSTGIAKIDDLLLKTIRSAGPFPPLPKHFNRKTLKTRMPFNMELIKGTHTYHISLTQFR